MLGNERGVVFLHSCDVLRARAAQGGVHARREGQQGAGRRKSLSVRRAPGFSVQGELSVDWRQADWSALPFPPTFPSLLSPRLHTHPSPLPIHPNRPRLHTFIPVFLVVVLCFPNLHAQLAPSEHTPARPPDVREDDRNIQIRL